MVLVGVNLNQWRCEIETKRCSKCKELKPVYEFYTDKRKLDGLKTQCKTCHNGYDKSEEAQEKNKQWRAAHPLEMREINKRAKDKRRYGMPREEVLNYYNYTCAQCGTSENLEVHHKDNLGSTVDLSIRNNDLDNMIVLCKSCHTKEHTPWNYRASVTPRGRKLKKAFLNLSAEQQKAVLNLGVKT